MEKIGLEAVFADKGFQAGIEKYNKQVDAATKNTTAAAASMSKTLAPASKIAGTQAGAAGQNIQAMAGSMGSLVNAAGLGSSALGTFASAAQMAGSVAGVYVGAQLAQATWEMGKAGAQTLRTRDSFAELARQAGGSGDMIVAAIQRATDSTVTSGQIMSAVNRGILLGLGANADQWEQLAEVARFRSRAMGIDMTQALDDITTGIGRESRMILDNLGIIIDVEQVTGDYAASLGKTADALTAAERKQAIMNSVIEVGQAQILAAGGITADAADEFAQLDVQLKSLSTVFNTAMTPAATEMALALQTVVGAVQDLSTGVSGPWVDALAGVFGPASGLGSVIFAFNELTGAHAEQAAARRENADAQRWAALATQYEAQQAQKAIPLTEQLTDDIWQQAAASAALAFNTAKAGDEAVALSEAEDKMGAAVDKAAERMVDAEEKAGQSREKARRDLLEAMSDAEADHARKVAELAQDLVDAEAKAARERAQLARDLARDIADAERSLQNDIVDAQREAARDQEDAQRDLNRTLLDLEWDYQQDLAGLQGDYNQEAADLEEERGQAEADIREQYKEARIQELVRLGQDEGTIRENWTDDMLQGPLKDQMDEELAALEEGYNADLAALQEELAREQAEREAAYQEQKARAAEQYEETRAEAEQEYQRKLEDLRIQHERELEEIERRNQEEMAALEEQLAQERTALERQRAEEEQSHLAREAELQRSYEVRLAEINSSLAEELSAIQRGLGLELQEIASAAEETAQSWRDSFAQQLIDQDQYYQDRLARDAQYQEELNALFGVHSKSAWMEEFGKNLRLGLDVGLTTPAASVNSSSVVNNQTVNLTMPTTVNNGMDAAALQQTILRTVTQALRV